MLLEIRRARLKVPVLMYNMRFGGQHWRYPFLQFWIQRARLKVPVLDVRFQRARLKVPVHCTVLVIRDPEIKIEGNREYRQDPKGKIEGSCTLYSTCYSGSRDQNRR